MPFTPAAISTPNTPVPRMAGGWHPHAMRLPDGSVRPTCLTAANVSVYFQQSPRDADWQALTAAEQDVATNQACRWLNTLCWDISIDCCDRDFADAWEMAFSELALWLHQNPTAIISGLRRRPSRARSQSGRSLGIWRSSTAQLRVTLPRRRTAAGEPEGAVDSAEGTMVDRHPWLLAADQLRHQPGAAEVLLTWTLMPSSCLSLSSSSTTCSPPRSAICGRWRALTSR